MQFSDSKAAPPQAKPLVFGRAKPQPVEKRPQRKSAAELKAKKWPHKLFRIPIVAKALDVDPTSLYDRISRGGLKAVYRGDGVHKKKLIYADEAAALVIAVRERTTSNKLLTKVKGKPPQGTLLRWGISNDRQRVGAVVETFETFSTVQHSSKCLPVIFTPEGLAKYLESKQVRLEDPLALLECVALHFSLRKATEVAAFIREARVQVIKMLEARAAQAKAQSAAMTAVAEAEKAPEPKKAPASDAYRSQVLEDLKKLKAELEALSSPVRQK